MTHTTKKIATLAVAIMSIVPFMGHAKDLQISLPDGAVGITEATYQELKNTVCTGGTPECGTLVDSLAGKIIFRAEHLGEMYIVSEKDELPSPIIRRYVPNGFYKTRENGKTKYFLVQDSYTIPLKKSNAFYRLNNLAENDTVVPVSENDFAAMGITCEGSSESCLTQYALGQTLFKQLWGKMIMRVENNGELYYVNPFDNNASALIPFDNLTANSEKPFAKIKEYAVHVPASVMKLIDSGKNRYY